MLKSKIALFSLSLTISLSSFAQTRPAVNTGAKTSDPSANLYSGWSAVVRLGLNQPYTDVNQYQLGKISKNNDWTRSENRPSFTIGVQKMMSNIVGVQGNLRFGSLQGSSRKYGGYKSSEDLFYFNQLAAQFPALFVQNNPIYFKTSVRQADLDLYVDWTNLGYSLLSSRKGGSYKRKFAVYTYLGAGMMSFDSKIYTTRTDSAFTKYLQGVSGKASEVVFPMAIGAKYKVNNKINLGVEYVLHQVLTDKLDGLVTNATGLRQHPGVYDKYGTPSLSFTYNFVGQDPAAENIEWANPYDERIANMKDIDTKALFADEDADGVIDLMDKEPSTPNGCRVDGAGRAMDTDGDGVIDCKDRERLSPSGYPVDQFGVAQIPDTDGDGVADNVDCEINSPAGCKVDAHGICPSKSKTDAGLGTYLPTVYFDTDKYNIKRQYITDLDLAVLTLKTHPDMRVNVIGNTDKHHTDEYNEKLGMRRAQSVASYLMSHGISKDRMVLKSNGKRNPVSDKDELNRRTEITVISQ